MVTAIPESVLYSAMKYDVNAESSCKLFGRLPANVLAGRKNSKAADVVPIGVAQKDSMNYRPFFPRK
jgi:hypothetical protein